MGKYKIEIKWAIIFAVMALVWIFLESITGLHSTHIDKHATFTNFFAIPAIAIYVLTLLDKQNHYYNGTMTYMQGFISGLIITVIVTLLSPVTQYLSTSVISPDFFRNMIEYVVEEGTMTREAAENYFNTKNYIIQGLIGAPVMGILTTAIVAIFTKKSGGNSDG